MPMTMSARAFPAGRSSCVRRSAARWTASITASSATPFSTGATSGKLICGRTGGRTFCRPQFRRACRGGRLRLQWSRIYDRRYRRHIWARSAAISGPGMTGGMAFVLDPDDSFASNANPESIVWQRLDSAHWEEQLKSLIMAHAHATDSAWSRSIIDDWDRRRGEFWQICPKEMLSRLALSAVGQGDIGGGGVAREENLQILYQSCCRMSSFVQPIIMTRPGKRPPTAASPPRPLRR